MRLEKQRRLFIYPLRPVVRSKATVRFETEPGYQSRVDRGQFSVQWLEQAHGWLD